MILSGNEFDALLFSSFNLNMSKHDVTLTNEGSLAGSAPEAHFMDVDYVR